MSRHINDTIFEETKRMNEMWHDDEFYNSYGGLFPPYYVETYFDYLVSPIIMSEQITKILHKDDYLIIEISEDFLTPQQEHFRELINKFYKVNQFNRIIVKNTVISDKLKDFAFIYCIQKNCIDTCSCKNCNKIKFRTTDEYWNQRDQEVIYEMYSKYLPKLEEPDNYQNCECLDEIVNFLNINMKTDCALNRHYPEDCDDCSYYQEWPIEKEKYLKKKIRKYTEILTPELMMIRDLWLIVIDYLSI
jgi:hypothetical protein